MRTHLRSMHSDPAFPCPGCDSVFRRSDKLKRHQKLAHGRFSVLAAVPKAPQVDRPPEAVPTTDDPIRAQTAIRTWRASDDPGWTSDENGDQEPELDPLGSVPRVPYLCMKHSTPSKDSDEDEEVGDEVTQPSPSLDAHQCHQCGKAYVNQSLLKRHMESTHKPPAFTCEHCGKMMRRRDALLNHLRMTHGLNIAPEGETRNNNPDWDPLKRRTCPKCDQVFSQSSGMKRHLENIHSDPAFPCPDCDHVFRRRVKLVEHQIRVHSQEGDADLGRFQCDECGKTTQGRQRHKDGHAGIRPHICETCGRGFRDAQDLRTHRLRHAGQRPFTCAEPNCDRAFRSKGALRTHVIVVHKGGRPFVCKESGCGQGFPNSTKLRTHARRNHKASQ